MFRENPQSGGGLAQAPHRPTGLSYLIHRYYDPSTGQFTSEDPLIDQTGQPYAYVAGDPINAYDLSGDCPACAVAGGADVTCAATFEMPVFDVGSRGFAAAVTLGAGIATAVADLSSGSSGVPVAVAHKGTGGPSGAIAVQAKTGPGEVPVDQRDPKRKFNQGQKKALSDSQDGACADCKDAFGDTWDAHHDQRWADGGLTEVSNGVGLCKTCHPARHKP